MLVIRLLNLNGTYTTFIFHIISYKINDNIVTTTILAKRKKIQFKENLRRKNYHRKIP